MCNRKSKWLPWNRSFRTECVSTDFPVLRLHTPEVGKSVWKCIYLNRSAFVCARIVLRDANEQTTEIRTKWEIQFCVVSHNILSFIEMACGGDMRSFSAPLTSNTFIIILKLFQFFFSAPLFLRSIFKAEWMRVKKKRLNRIFRGENPTTTHQLPRQRSPQSVRQEARRCSKPVYCFACNFVFTAISTFIEKCSCVI